MLFSVIVPTYNRSYLINRNLDSLLNQTISDFEVIVIDDGSTDDTEDIVKSYYSKIDIKYFKKENGGKHTALNVGIYEARGELIAILDSDDLFFYNTLERVKEIWEKTIRQDMRFVGIMGRCIDYSNSQKIGIPFKKNTINYLEFHFGKNAGKYKDCCEFIRADILKQYSWPTKFDTKFIPESYVFDQIGLKFDLYCTNEQFKIIEYMKDGISLNVREHLKKNHIGYLIDACSKIDDVIPNTNLISFRSKIIIWWQYWNLVKLDKEKKGVRCTKKSILGLFIFIILPIINIIHKTKQKFL